MKYLFINGAGWTAEGQIGDTKTFRWFSWITDRNLVGLLPSLLDEMLEQQGWKIDDIDVLGVGTGPGSLTGLRVVGSFFRMLADISKNP